MKIKNVKLLVYGTITLIMLLLLTFPLLNQNKYTVTVTEKVIKSVGEDGQKYLIFTQLNNGEIKIFENTDEFIKFKFNSSNIQAQIKVGETYQFDTVGYRIPFLSNYENIVEVNEIKENK